MVCVTCVWAGVDNVQEQRKLEARKRLKKLVIAIICPV